MKVRDLRKVLNELSDDDPALDLPVTVSDYHRGLDKWEPYEVSEITFGKDEARVA